MKHDLIVCSYGSPDTTLKCSVNGTIVCPDTEPKRIGLFLREDKDLRIVSLVHSLPDKTWNLYGYGFDDNSLILMGIDDTGEYDPDSYDRVSLSDKVFAYSSSHLKQIEGKDFLLHSLLFSLDRTLMKSFYNWIYDIEYQDFNDNYILTNFIPCNYGATNIKSVILDIEGNWGGSYVGVKRVEFYDETDTLIPLTSSDFTAYCTAQYSSYVPANAFDTTISKVGAWTVSNHWLGTNISQRLICVFNTVKNINRIVINNTHSNGTATNSGARYTAIHLSTDTITNTVYSNPLTNSVCIANVELRQHIASNDIDDIPIANQNMAENMMLGVKSVIFDCLNNYGATTYLALRSIEFYDSNGVKIVLSTSDFTAYSTTQQSTTYLPSNVFTTTSKIGSWNSSQWLSLSTHIRRQRLICVFNTVKDIKYMVINNSHNTGVSCDTGVKSVKIYLSSDTITDVYYDSPITNSVCIFNGILPQHTAVNTIDSFFVKKDCAMFLTDFSNNIVSPPLENSFIITCKDENSYKVYNLSGNTFNVTPPIVNDYSVLCKDITAFIKQNGKYTGVSNPITITLSSPNEIPMSWENALDSITSVEIKDVIGFVEPEPEYGVLCIQGGGENGSNTFIDKSVSTFPITYVGAVYSETQYKFAPTSIAFLVSGHYLRVSANNTFNLGTRDFTICYWFYKATYTANNTHFDIGTNGSLIRNDATNLKLFAPTSATTILSTPNPSANVWHHLVLTRISGKFYLYIDKVLVVSSTSTYNTTAFGTSAALTIGNYGSAGAYFLNGYMEEFRLLLEGMTQEDINALPDARQTEYVIQQETGTTSATIYYSLSFGNESTYKVWNNSVWRSIASNDPSIHGNSGDTDWYYRDNANTWSKTGISNNSKSAVSKAVSYANNQMESSTLNSLTGVEFTSSGGFSESVGYVDMGISFISSVNGNGAIISSLDINDDTENLWYLKPVSVDITDTITSSKISWNYKKSSFDFDSNVEISTLLSGQTSWNVCGNGGSIVGLTEGLTAPDKILYVRIKAPKLTSNDVFDPALFLLEISVL